MAASSRDMENICDACGQPIDGAELVGVVIRGGRKDGGSWTLLLCDLCLPASNKIDKTTSEIVVEQLADDVAKAIVEAQVARRELTIDDVRGIASKAIGSA